MGAKGHISQVSGIAKGLRSRLFFVGKVVVAAGLLLWLLTSGRLDFSILADVRHPIYLAAAGGLLLTSRILQAWRWLALLQMQRLPINWLSVVRMVWLGHFVSLFLPGAVGGDLARAYAACRYRQKAKAQAVSTILVDRILGLHCLLFLGAVSGVVLLFNKGTSRQSVVAIFPVVLLAVSTGGLFLAFWRPTSGFAIKLLPRRLGMVLRDLLGGYRSNWRKISCLWLLSGLCAVFTIGAFCFAAVALGIDLTITELATVIPLVFLANSIPISPGGLGTGEAAACELFMIFGSEEGAILVFVMRLVGVVISLPGVVAMAGRLEGVPQKGAIENSTSELRSKAMFKIHRV